MNREKREWQPREMRMVSEYLQLNYSKYLCRQRVVVIEPGTARANLTCDAGAYCRGSDT